MKRNTNYEQALKQCLLERKKWQAKREAVAEKNRRLIAYWNSLPWYKFWKKPSFEIRREIILANWRKLPPCPSYPPLPFLFMPPDTATGSSH